MKSAHLFNHIQINSFKSVDFILENIQLYRKTIEVYQKEIERHEKSGNLNAADQIKFQSIPEVESAIVEAKKTLLKIIAETAFKSIDSL
jgi:predicted transcriptional regulator